jgi:DNA-binding HxlR family transcriptional regulator
VKSYGQQCSLARALDVVGERWNLLIVRELLLGPRRYSDLLDGLPGVSTNLLAGRLAQLQGAGVVSRRMLPPPAAAAVYELSEAGRALRPVLAELRAWGQQYGPRPNENDAVRPAWALLSVAGCATPLPAGRIVELRIDRDCFQLAADGDRLTVANGPAPVPTATIKMQSETLYALLGGKITTKRAHRLSIIDGEQETADLLLDTLQAASIL